MSNSIDRLTVSTLNPCILEVKYAVRGPIVARATELQKELENPKNGDIKPFKKVIRCNIGDSHAVGQKFITFYRQVIAGCSYPELTKTGLFPEDVNQRVTQLLSSLKGSIGCYSESIGVESIRKNVAKFISKRDGYDSNYNNIFLTQGATAGVKLILYSLKISRNGLSTGVLVPIPQYPLYSATLSENEEHMIGYYLNEERNWELDIAECDLRLKENVNKCIPRAMVVINPGNPTGQVLPYSNMVQIVKFCHTNGLLLIADEVYQDNIYDENIQFYSFKKVVLDLGLTENNFQMVSLHSVSKGFHGECGLRGGYMEIFGFDSELRKQLVKLLSAQLCPSTIGQIVVDLVVNPPSPDDPSGPLYYKEKNLLIQSYKEKAQFLQKELNKIPGISCNPIQGALYAFPRITLPQKFIDEARAKGMPADEAYCFKLLEEKGICVIPGSGFNQKIGTFHFRTTIIPSIKDITELVFLLHEFQSNLINRYT